jgi:hypothetical protein
MKKISTLFVILFMSVATFGQSSLVNGNFEGWFYAYHPTHAGQGFWEPQGPFFKTLNILDTIPTPPGLTVFRTDSAHAGSYGVRCKTQSIAVMQVLIPGVVGTIEVDWIGMRAILGQPYTWNTKPSHFEGYVRSYPVNGDSSAAILLLSKWNTTTKKRDTIAYNRIVFHGTIDAYEKFDEAVNYIDNTTMPDSITVLLLSCAGYNATFMLGSVGQVGSQALFDDVTLTDIAGNEYLLMPEFSVKLSPVPVADQLTVTLSSELKEGRIEIYTTQGQTITNLPLKNLRNTLPVNALKNGIYYYKVSDGRSILNSGSFIVSR